LLLGYLPLPSLFFLIGDSPIDCKLSFKDCIAVILAKCSISSLSLSSSFCLFYASHLSFDIFLQHLSHTLWSLFNRGSFLVIQGSMFLKLFLTLLCPLSLNGLQHKALVMRDAIIIVNTLNQQNLYLVQMQRRTFRIWENLTCPKNKL
jgi:hypothetical protein